MSVDESVSDVVLGAEAARLIWDDDPAAGALVDPRTPEFAHAMIDTSVTILRSSRGLIKRMIDRAAAGAEDLAVEQFQGIIEVIQNADDVRATEVRFALREKPGKRQLLIVHNGQPVTCHNVLGMALPYLTTKTDRVDQRGRFGIGMKTLKRIADAVSIHSAPYHFSGDQLRFDRIGPENAIPGFYDPTLDTMLVADLNASFHEDELKEWCEAWEADSLLFLASVCRFRWCTLDGQSIAERTLAFSAWEPVHYTVSHASIDHLVRRQVNGPAGSWTVWRATVAVPAHLHPAHKARSDFTDISVAIANDNSPAGLFIGFRSQVPLSVPFSIDAQFDPSTSREAIIENPWNNWLIDRTGEVLATIAAEQLRTNPLAGWSLVPLESETVGKADDRWLSGRFASAFAETRDWLAKQTSLTIQGTAVPLERIVHEEDYFTNVLGGADLEQLEPECTALPTGHRDDEGRWREVLNALGVSPLIDAAVLLSALRDGQFSGKPPEWCVAVASRLVQNHPDDELFDTPFLLTDDLRIVSCREADESQKPLVYDAAPSPFAMRWRLMDRLHPAFGHNEDGKEVIAWLSANAAFTSHLEPEIELAAFAEHFAGNRIEITDEELRELRESFDSVSDRRAERLGPSVGDVLLVDGLVYKGGKPARQKVALTEAYLSKTLDGENSTWPDAAGTTPGIQWIAAKYEDVLKTGARRWAKRKREDGSISRGPRRFLTLLGAETAPRVVETDGRVRWGEGARYAELRARRAEQVEYDYLSPALSSVLKALRKLSKRDVRQRSPALLRTLSRHWDRLYAPRQRVPAEHVATKYIHSRGEVTAAWLNELRESDWVAVGRGELVAPDVAVLKTSETQALYQVFVCDIALDEVSADCAVALKLIVDVRVGDLVGRLEEIRDQAGPVDDLHILQLYRTIAKRCPRVAAYNALVGEMSVQELRRRFLAGTGLVYVGNGTWKRPDEVMRGVDIFHDRRLFVPGGPGCASLWVTLGVEEPTLDDCIQFCRELAAEEYSLATDAVLMDVYRYMEEIVGTAERRHRDKLRQLPLYCTDKWVSTRPVFWIENAELRQELVARLPSLNCWTPPCDLRDFPGLGRAIGVEVMALTLSVEQDMPEEEERGEQLRLRYGHAVDHLSSELARSEPTLRDRINISWDTLKAIPLYVSDGVIPVRVKAEHLPSTGIVVGLRAYIDDASRRVYVRDDDIGDREFGGRAIASFFPLDVRRRIGGEWALAWLKSRDTAAEVIRLASDERRTEAMAETAAAINAAPKSKIKVTPPKSRETKVEPRTLKQSAGAVVGATVQPGTQSHNPKQAGKKQTKGLHSTPPKPSEFATSGKISAPAAYTNADLEQRGWEILKQALETSPDQRLTDFRQRHGVGADGVFDWKRFVEMKATARAPQTQIELSNNEFERAKQRGSDFILALVSGLETGQKDEVRLIFDPANCATMRPANGVKLVGLLDAPAVVIHFEEASEEAEAD
ncbi:DUF3883 domain-containing protein [Stappia sp. WLB 29]|uniref:sacsin N-terminal ATP-binding-like domain-containing protein n=1 Tax=Stappia sp. WLB 29 TaxID=2925220 RepID=UPI0020C090C4|nr:DUF3883 domain-containing protein [Stappia sp. WLB 29]